MFYSAILEVVDNRGKRSRIRIKKMLAIALILRGKQICQYPKWECHSFRVLGAVGISKYSDKIK